MVRLIVGYKELPEVVLNRKPCESVADYFDFVKKAEMLLYSYLVDILISGSTEDLIEFMQNISEKDREVLMKGVANLSNDEAIMKLLYSARGE